MLISTGDLSTLADTTVLLLLFVFTIVNVAVLVLRREDVEHDHFSAPSVFPVLGAIVLDRADRGHRSQRRSAASRAPGYCRGGALLWLLNRVLDGPPTRSGRSSG